MSTYLLLTIIIVIVIKKKLLYNNMEKLSWILQVFNYKWAIYCSLLKKNHSITTVRFK
jgi:hypothetical protein